MSETLQKAVAVTGIGRPVQQIKRPIPTPGPGELLVKVEAVHLLPHDAYGRDRGLFVTGRTPWVLGGDYAGTVEKIGPSTTTSLKLGDKVFGMGNIGRPTPDEVGLQEYALLTARHAAKVPHSIKLEDASTIPLNLATSFIALFTKRFGFGLPAPWSSDATDFDYASQSLVIIGAGSNLAKFAIQLAKIVGIGTIIAIAGPANVNELKDMGATHVLDRHDSIESITSQVHAITGPEGATHIYDCYSWTFELAASIVPKTKASRLLVVHRSDFKLVEKERPLCNASFVQCSNENLGEYAVGFYERLAEWIEKGQILPAAWKAIGGLDDVNAINAVLDDYRDGKGGAQAIVKP